MQLSYMYTWVHQVSMVLDIQLTSHLPTRKIKLASWFQILTLITLENVWIYLFSSQTVSKIVEQTELSNIRRRNHLGGGQLRNQTLCLLRYDPLYLKSYRLWEDLDHAHPLTGQVVLCFPHLWPQFTSISFFNSPLFFLVVRMILKFQLLIVIDIFWVVVLGLSDSIRKLHKSPFYL